MLGAVLSPGLLTDEEGVVGEGEVLSRARERSRGGCDIIEVMTPVVPSYALVGIDPSP